MSSDFKSGPRVKDPDLLKRFRLSHLWEPCEECELRPGTQIHHRTLRSQGGNDVEGNLQWLCHHCHDERHGIRSF